MRGASAHTLLLDQCLRQMYEGVYIGKLTFAEFAEAMDAVFEGVQCITFFRIKVKYETPAPDISKADPLWSYSADQWATRKRAWDKLWGIKKGGPYPAEILKGLESQPLWFSVGPNKTISYKPFELDNHALYVPILGFYVIDG